jgi:DNA-binding CsgD family transcriptional regulator
MHYRAIRQADLDACAAILPPAAAPGGVGPTAVAALWRELLREARIDGGVVVEGPSDRLLAFGLTAFVDEPFLADYLAAPRPSLAASVYEAARSNGSVLLGPAAVRHANEAGTLNFVILHFHLAPDLDPAVAQGVVAAAETGFRLAHGGYRVRRLLQEAHGRYEEAMLRGAGLRLKSDYADHFAATGEESSVAERPVLMGLYVDDPESHVPGSTAAALFHHAEPRFYFSPGEQRVLARAVLDESDEEIAGELGLSIAAVKKNWRRAYERVADKDPGLLAVDGSGPGSTRGKEKRRNLVRYLRYHLHELRPMTRRTPRG